MTTDPLLPTRGAEPAEIDDTASRPVEDHGSDQPSEGRDVNAGTRSDDSDADEADHAREGFEDDLDADRAKESMNAEAQAPVDPPSGGFDPPDVRNV